MSTDTIATLTVTPGPTFGWDGPASALEWLSAAVFHEDPPTPLEDSWDADQFGVIRVVATPLAGLPERSVWTIEADDFDTSVAIRHICRYLAANAVPSPAADYRMLTGIYRVRRHRGSDTLHTEWEGTPAGWNMWGDATSDYFQQGGGVVKATGPGYVLVFYSPVEQSVSLEATGLSVQALMSVHHVTTRPRVET